MAAPGEGWWRLPQVGPWLLSWRSSRSRCWSRSRVPPRVRPRVPPPRVPPRRRPSPSQARPNRAQARGWGRG
eukprot:scaffold102123_cov51-Phaeocystis_antarctica.AAC.1